MQGRITRDGVQYEVEVSRPDEILVSAYAQASYGARRDLLDVRITGAIRRDRDGQWQPDLRCAAEPQWRGGAFLAPEILDSESERLEQAAVAAAFAWVRKRDALRHVRDALVEQATVQATILQRELDRAIVEDDPDRARAEQRRLELISQMDTLRREFDDLDERLRGGTSYAYASRQHRVASLRAQLEELTAMPVDPPDEPHHTGPVPVAAVPHVAGIGLGELD